MISKAHIHTEMLTRNRGQIWGLGQTKISAQQWRRYLESFQKASCFTARDNEVPECRDVRRDAFLRKA